jgi:hypothetical protein
VSGANLVRVYVLRLRRLLGDGKGSLLQLGCGRADAARESFRESSAIYAELGDLEQQAEVNAECARVLRDVL